MIKKRSSKIEKQYIMRIAYNGHREIILCLKQIQPITKRFFNLTEPNSSGATQFARC